MMPEQLVRSKSAFVLSTEQFFQGRVANERPYEPLDMSTAKWGDVPVREVPLDDVIASQYEVSANRISHSIANPGNTDFGGDEYPLFVKHQGEVYLVDGHHRVVAAMAQGQSSVKGRVLGR